MKKYFEQYKLYILILIIIISIIYIGNYFTTDKSSINQTSYSVEKASIGEISEKVLVTGRVETANYLPINTSVNGIVSKIYVKEGDKVYKGQKIMEIKLNNDGEIDYQSALSSYNSAAIALAKAKSDMRSKQSTLINSKYDFERVRDKSRDTIEYKNSYTTALNTYKTAQDSISIQEDTVKQAEISLNKAYLSLLAQSPSIIAPDSGTVANILFVEGMGIKNSLTDRSSVSVASIKNPGKPIVSFNLSELDINKIQVGQKVNINFTNGDRKNFTGEVAGIDRVGNISNNLAQYSVIVRINEESDKILPNMKIEGEIITSLKEKVLKIPSGAVKGTNGSSFITLEDGTRKQVEVGISDGTFTEVISGLNDGDLVRIEALPTSGFINTNNQFRTPNLFGR